MPFPFQITSYEDYKIQYARSVRDPEGFWDEIAGNFQWQKRRDRVLDWNFREPNIKWFEGARLNITENCLDRHLAAQPDKPAIIWESNDPGEDSKTFTYRELHREVVAFAAVLKNNGVRKGDRVCIYLGMVPELAISMLACARIGAIHSVIFGGFSAQSISDRVQDAHAEFVLNRRWRISREQGNFVEKHGGRSSERLCFCEKSNRAPAHRQRCADGCRPRRLLGRRAGESRSGNRGHFCGGYGSGRSAVYFIHQRLYGKA